MKASLLCRELLAQLLDRHILRFLDYPKVENFSLNNEVVLISNLLLYVGNFLAWESRNDTVYQCSAYIAVVCEPIFESLIVAAEVFLPQFDVFVDALFQMMTVEEYQFARHDDETLCRIAVECLETVVEKLYELARIR